MHGTYNPYLVALSLIVSILASYTALDLAARIRLIDVSSWKRIHWLLGGSLAMGGGIWSMHFIGMLALEMPMNLGYDPWITACSFLSAVAISYLALHLTSKSELSTRRLFLGGVVMAAGVAAMHYMGMAAMRMDPGIRYNPARFLLSIAIALGASWAALYIAYSLRDDQRFVFIKRLGAGVIMGIAIAGMHYTGMSAAIFPRGSVCRASGGINPGTLVLIVSITSLFGLMTTLILTILVSHFDLVVRRSDLSLEEANQRLQILATVDTLTGIPNRSFFLQTVEQRVLSSKKTGVSFSIIFIDLDGFKTINDSLGHPVGDEMLKLFSNDLQRCARPQDIVARLGGDEFVILLEGGHAEIETVAASVLKRMERDFMINRMPLRVTASLGSASYPADGETVAVLLKNADIAMYDAKQHGKNAHRFFTRSLSDAAGRIPRIYRGLGEALEKKQFSLVFQPKFGGPDNNMVGAEALIRWVHPVMGNIAPMDFIPIAEQTGQIVQISEWVICEVCRRIKQWDRLGLRKLKIAINLSPEELRLADYASRVAKMVLAAGVEPERIMFEITETAAMKEPDNAAEMIRNFQEAGFDIAIDDFGTGYSSMAYLQKFRVKELKIDRFFIRALDDEGQEGHAIISAIISLAHSLNMKVVAEGVETPSQLEQLTQMRCDELQGYLLAKPLSLDDFETLLSRGALASAQRLEAERSTTSLRSACLQTVTT